MLCVIGLAVAGCGRDDDGSDRAPTATSSSTAPDDQPSTTVDACASEALEATEVGVTDSTITVTVMADVGSPLAPGLFQANLDAVQAFATRVNANGGIGCRQLEVKTWDSKLDATEAKNGLIDACATSVAMVGGNALFNPDPSPLVDCVDQAGVMTGLPDIAALANDINEQCNATTYMIQVVSEPCTSLSGSRDLRALVGPTNWFLDNVDAGLHGLFLVPADLPTTVQSATYQIAAQSETGITFDATPKVSGRDEQAAYTPRIQAAKAANSTYVYNGSNERAMIAMRKEAKAQGLDSGEVWACHLGCYTKQFLQSGGADVEGTYLSIQFLPFEEADLNAEARAYRDAVGADNVTSNGAQAWQAAVLFAQVVDNIVAKDGPNAITRAAMLEELAATEDFTANGWLGEKDLKGFSPCFVIMQVQNGAFARVYPTEAGTLDCDASNVVTVRIDPAEEAKKIA